MSESKASGILNGSESCTEGISISTVPLVSISIITYNHVRWIRGCIESALAQDYPNLEIVVADDASTDGTREVVQSLALEYPDVVKPVLSQVNGGITRNSNNALRNCMGKYVALCAGDDILLPDKVRKQAAWMEENDRRVLCGHYVNVMNATLDVSEGIYRTGLAGEQGEGCVCVIRYGPGSTFQGSSVMVRREAIPAGGFDERIPIASDWKFMIDVIGEMGVWGTVPEVLCLYRRHTGNVTTLRYEAILMDTLKTLELVGAERPWLGSETVAVRRLYEYAWQKSLFLQGDNRANKWKIAAVLPNPPPGVPRWKALALLVSMCIGGSRLRAALNAREARKAFIASASPREART
jgi:glycosyltransferase involved in cell wall biosynthesis